MKDYHPLKKKKKKKKKVLDHYLHHDLGMLPLLWWFFAHLLMLQYPDHHQNLISSSFYYSGLLHKISSQSVHNFLSNVVHRQTDKQTDKLTNATKNITSFAKEVKRFAHSKRLTYMYRFWSSLFRHTQLCSAVLCFRLISVLETRLEKLLVRGASKLKKLLALLKSSLSSYFDGVRCQSIKLIMIYFRFRFPQGFVWVCFGKHTHFITPRAATFSDTF